MPKLYDIQKMVILWPVVEKPLEELCEHGDVDLPRGDKRVGAADDRDDGVEEEEDEEVGDDGGGRDLADLAVPHAVQDQETHRAYQPGK